MLLRKRAWDMMREEYATVLEDASLAETIRVMRESMKTSPDSHVVVVVDKAGKTVGAVSVWATLENINQQVLKNDKLRIADESDWDTAFSKACTLAAHIRLDKVMFKDPIVFKPSDTLPTILDTMLRRQRTWALVMESGKTIGVLFLSDLYREITRDMVEIG